MVAKTRSTFLRNTSTVVGSSILINGRLSGDENLIVRGRVEGEVTLSRTLIVERSGIVKADVCVKNAIVSGVVVGNIRASACVELTPGGRMVGDISSPRVIVVEGASFRGRIDMGDAVRTKREHPEEKAIDAGGLSRFSPQQSAPVQGVSVPPLALLASTPSDFDDGITTDKPLPPEPPMLMDESKKRLVLKKKD